MTTEPMPIRIVEGLTTTNEIGRIISVLPARYVDADTAVDEIGNAIETIPFEEVDGLITLNSAGQAVPVIPVRIVEGTTALNEANQRVGVLALRGSGGTPTPPITLAAPTYYDAFDYADGTRLVAGDPNANAGLVATNPGNLGWDALRTGAANNSRFNSIVYQGVIRDRTTNSTGDFAAPGSYVTAPPVAQAGDQYMQMEVLLSNRPATTTFKGTDQSTRLSLRSTANGGGVNLSKVIAGTTTSVVGASSFNTKPRMGGATGQFRVMNDAVEKITCLYVNGKVHLRRGPGFALATMSGTTCEDSGGDRFGIPTLVDTNNWITSMRVGPAPMVLMINETFSQWVAKRRDNAGDSLSTGYADRTFTGTYEGGTAPTRLQWALFHPGTGAVLKDWAWVAEADTTISGGNWTAVVRRIPAGLNGIGAYAIGFRPTNAAGETDVAWQVVSNRQFYVTLNIGILGQSNGAYLANNVTGADYPRTEGILAYSKADPPSTVVGTFGNSTAFWADTVTFGTGKVVHTLGEALSALYNVPVSFEILAIAARGAADVGPNGADWSYIQTHHGYCGSAYEILYLSQGEAEMVSGGSSWLNEWANVNIPAYRDPAMTGQPVGTVIPLFHAFTGRHTGTTSDTLASTKAMREGQEALAAAVSNCYPAHHYVGVKMADSYHYTNLKDEGYAEAARRIKLSMSKVLTGTGYDGMGPIATTATRSGAVITIDFDLNGATSMTCRNGEDQSLTATATALTSWEVSNDDFATTLTISSAHLVGNEVVLTLSADPGGPVKVRNHYGFQPTVTSWAFGAYADGTYIGSKPIITPLVGN